MSITSVLYAERDVASRAFVGMNPTCCGLMPLLCCNKCYQRSGIKPRPVQILKQREEIKRKTMIKRRLRHKTENASTQSKMSQSLQSQNRSAVPNYLTTNS